MREIPLNAAVECTDGYAGKATHVLFDPQQRTVTYIVIKNDRDAAAQDRLAPVAAIEQTSPSLIRLNCTLAELAQQPAFSSTHTFSYTYDDYSISAATLTSPYNIAPAKTTTYAERVVEAIPSGQRVLRRGVKVEATDGVVGQVGDLLLDPESGEITHFTLQDGHAWGKQKITVPVSIVQFVAEDVVYLKLDRRAIGSLPAVPVKRRFAQGDQPGGIELIARVFDTPQRAGEALEFVKDVQRRQRGALKIHNAAVLVKDADGNVTINETGDLSPRKGMVLGAVAGGLLGALAGPVGILVGAAAGAGVGRVSTHWIDLGLPDDFLNRLQGYLQPGSSALIVLVEHEYEQQLATAMAGLEGIVLHHTLVDAVAQQLLAEDEA
jgi:uncharacterized membrane protein/sporulation protein YlmC with PRC-barrel domain